MQREETVVTSVSYEMLSGGSKRCLPNKRGQERQTTAGGLRGSIVRWQLGGGWSSESPGVMRGRGGCTRVAEGWTGL